MRPKPIREWCSRGDHIHHRHLDLIDRPTGGCCDLWGRLIGGSVPCDSALQDAEPENDAAHEVNHPFHPKLPKRYRITVKVLAGVSVHWTRPSQPTGQVSQPQRFERHYQTVEMDNEQREPSENREKEMTHSESLSAGSLPRRGSSQPRVLSRAARSGLTKYS
jgi:hypothetical protein